jgi:hypothetical protein
VISANAAVAGAYAHDDEPAEELVTASITRLERAPTGVNAMIAVGLSAALPQPVSLESSDGGEALADTIGLDEPGGAEAWIDETGG